MPNSRLEIMGDEFLTFIDHYDATQISCEFSFRPLYLLTDLHTYGLLGAHPLSTLYSKRSPRSVVGLYPTDAGSQYHPSTHSAFYDDMRKKRTWIDHCRLSKYPILQMSYPHTR